MRIVAGRHGGRTIATPRGSGTRPTSDRVREALFSSLASRDAIAGADVLDLFAGSGALGLEALSRGAASATFVDSASAATRAVTANLRALGEEAAVVRSDAAGFLRRARAGGRQYDLVFIDPPYRQATALGPALSEALAAVLAAGGIVVSESDRRAPLDLAGLSVLHERRYGDTLIRIHGR